MAHTKEQLAESLRRLGLAAGDTVVVHTSLRSLGAMEDGAQSLYEALLEVLGEAGTALFPNHTLSYLAWGRPPFDPATTPGSTGAFPEFVRKQPGVCRSCHPVHSVLAVGKRAEEITRDHDPCDALGKESPYHRLYDWGGKVLLLGVNNHANTMIHLGEVHSGLGYTALPFSPACVEGAHRIEADGSIGVYVQRQYPGCCEEFPSLTPYLEEAGLGRTGKVGDGDCTLYDARPLVDFTAAFLQKHPDFFMCNRDWCKCCPPRRDFLAAHGPIEKE